MTASLNVFLAAMIHFNVVQHWRGNQLVITSVGGQDEVCVALVASEEMSADMIKPTERRTGKPHKTTRKQRSDNTHLTHHISPAVLQRLRFHLHSRDVHVFLGELLPSTGG